MEVLSGILNGIDTGQWNPETDPAIPVNYTHSTLNKKQQNKTALQKALALPVNNKVPLFGLISRLVEQKGIDLLLDSAPDLVNLPLQLAVLGSGNQDYEKKLLEMAEAHPRQIAVIIGYDEALSHLIEAGADIFLMPSRYEPCGLNQMYSQRYGTIPIVFKSRGAGGYRGGRRSGNTRQQDGDRSSLSWRAFGYFIGSHQASVDLVRSTRRMGADANERDAERFLLAA